MLIAGPMCAWGWLQWVAWQERREQEAAELKFHSGVRTLADLQAIQKAMEDVRIGRPRSFTDEDQERIRRILEGAQDSPETADSPTSE